jgi:RNA polymerase sigma-70 factor (ECF subfamily)
MRAYQDLVYSSAARITGNDAQAEDIAQETFIKAYQHFDMLRNSVTAGGWLRAVARNLALNHATRYRRRWRFFSEMQEPGEEDDTDFAANIPGLGEASDETVHTQRSVLIEEALRTLPDHQRVPLVLFHFEEMPYDEIAKQLRISLAKVKVDIHRARAALARKLAAIGISADDTDFTDG